MIISLALCHWCWLQVNEGQFIQQYEAPGLPVVITHSQLDWQASRKWTLEVWGKSLQSQLMTQYSAVSLAADEVVHASSVASYAP